MKKIKKISAYLLTLTFILVSISTSVFATTTDGTAQGWLSNATAPMDGEVETEVNVNAMNGTVELTEGNPGDVNSSLTFTVSPNLGYKYVTYNSIITNNMPDSQSGNYYHNPEMRSLWAGSDVKDTVSVDIGSYFTFHFDITSPENNDTFVVVVTTERSGDLTTKIIAHLEPEIIAAINFEFTKIPDYVITSVSNPAGVASFTGTGVQAENTPYEVEAVDVNPAYEFVGWTGGSPTGTLTSNVDLVANYRLKELPPPPVVTVNYTLTVNVEGVGNVPGFLGSNVFSSGTNVNLEAVVTDATYQFVGWKGDIVSTQSNEVVIMTSDKTLTAVFELIPVDIDTPDEVVPEEPTVEEPITDSTTEILEEAVAQEITVTELPDTAGVPMEVISLLGASMASIGFVLRKKNK